MAAANASARGQRAAILASLLHELTGFYHAVDCLASGCGGERTFALAELASFYGRDRTVGEVLRRMQCSGACGGRVGAAWLVTGPVLNMRVRPRRVALLGPEARSSDPTHPLGPRTAHAWRLRTTAFSVAPSNRPSGCLVPSPSMPIAASRVSSLVTRMPSIWIARRSSSDRSAAIHSRIRSADSATNRRDTADFDTHDPAVAAMSPSG